MRVVFLYGPPGVGKLTVGTELAARTGFRLFHNHLTVDLVTAVFPRESAAWLRLLRHIRRDVFAEAVRAGVDLVFTGVATGTPAHAEAMRVMLEPVRAGGGAVLFVQLVCDRATLLRRVQDESRRARGKLTDPAVLTARYDLTATLPFTPNLRLDTTSTPPAETACRIIDRYDLGPAPAPPHA